MSDKITKKEKCKHYKMILTKKVKQNPWIISTIVLGILMVILILGNLNMIKGSKNMISEIDAGQKIVDFANSQTGGGVELVSSKLLENGLYEVTVSYNGNNIPLYLTNDGKSLVQGVTPLDSIPENTQQQTTPTEVPKSDKPVVELFIWGYCPSGVQAQGPLADVASLLSNYADFKAVLYYDGHGAFETQQNKIQECVQEIAPEKYWSYASGFVNDIYPKCSSAKTEDCDKTESVKLMTSLGIDSNKVLSCVETKGDSLLQTASSRARELGVTGSPSLVINGVLVNSARTADAYKTAVCGAFNNAPEICGTQLDSTQAAAAGNC